jgi:glutamyl-tRNA reductase
LIFLIDIAVPRDVDPAVEEIDNVFLYNIDNLQEIVDENVKNRMREADKAEAIIADEVTNFSNWLNTLEVVPAIVSLRNKADSIINNELEKSLSWMRDMNEEEKERIRILAASIVNKILHDPITRLKEESQNGGADPYVAAIMRLFKLEADD